MELHLRATGRRLSQCYQSPDTSEHPTLPQPDRPVLDLPTLEGWKAELT